MSSGRFWNLCEASLDIQAATPGFGLQGLGDSRRKVLGPALKFENPTVRQVRRER